MTVDEHAAPAVAPPQPASWLPIAAAGVTVVLWSSAFVAVRFVGEEISAGPLALGRLLVGSLVLGVVLLPRPRLRPSGRDWPIEVTVWINQRWQISCLCEPPSRTVGRPAPGSSLESSCRAIQGS